MLDPNAPEQTTQPRKLVLPSHPADQLHPNDRTQYVRPEQLIRKNSASPPGGPLTKLRYFWNKDSAYKILIIAVATVVISGLIFSVLGSIALLQNSSGAAQDTSVPQNPPTASSPGNPTFPTPGGTSGSTASSQPPKHSTVTVTPDVTVSGLPTPNQGESLAVAITNPPVQVSNNSKVPIEVATNYTLAPVRLQVQYDAPPFSYVSPLYTTDGSGSAIIPWRVHIRGRGFSLVTATLVAIVINPSNGEQNSSAPIVVRIDTTGG